MFADRTVESRKARALEKAKEEIYKKHPRLRAGRLSAQETESELAAVEKEILLAKYKINNDFRDLQNVADVYREEKRLKQEQKRQKSTKNRPRNKFPSGR